MGSVPPYARRVREIVVCIIGLNGGAYVPADHHQDIRSTYIPSVTSAGLLYFLQACKLISYILQVTVDWHSPTASKRRIDQHRPEAEEASKRAMLKIPLHGARLPPVPEAVHVFVRVPTNHGDERQHDQPHGQETLQTRRDELGLAVEAHCEYVEHEREYQC